MNESYNLRLVFNTDQNKLYQMSLTGADPFIEAEDIIAAMNDVIGANVIITTNGELTGRQSARLFKTEIQEINVV